MKKFKETTKDFPPHVYILNDDKRRAFGYIKDGETEVIMFSKPLKFDPKWRTFKEVK